MAKIKEKTEEENKSNILFDKNKEVDVISKTVDLFDKIEKSILKRISDNLGNTLELKEREYTEKELAERELLIESNIEKFFELNEKSIKKFCNDNTKAFRGGIIPSDYDELKKEILNINFLAVETLEISPDGVLLYDKKLEDEDKKNNKLTDTEILNNKREGKYNVKQKHRDGKTIHNREVYSIFGFITYKTKSLYKDRVIKKEETTKDPYILLGFYKNELNPIHKNSLTLYYPNHLDGIYNKENYNKYDVKDLDNYLDGVK